MNFIEALKTEKLCQTKDKMYRVSYFRKGMEITLQRKMPESYEVITFNNSYLIDFVDTDWEVVEDKVIPLSEKEISKYYIRGDTDCARMFKEECVDRGQGMFFKGDIKEAVKELKKRFAGSGYDDVRYHINKVLEEIFGDLVE